MGRKKKEKNLNLLKFKIFIKFVSNDTQWFQLHNLITLLQVPAHDYSILFYKPYLNRLIFVPMEIVTN